MNIFTPIASFLLGLSLVTTPYTDTYVAPKQLTISEKIAFYSDKYGVDKEFIKSIISCETSGTFNSKIQSGYKYSFSDSKRGIVKGDRERSFGLVQIHLPDNPEVTYEQAIDPDFAIDFLTKNVSNGNGWMWSCHPINSLANDG